MSIQTLYSLAVSIKWIGLPGHELPSWIEISTCSLGQLGHFHTCLPLHLWKRLWPPAVSMTSNDFTFTDLSQWPKEPLPISSQKGKRNPIPTPPLSAFQSFQAPEYLRPCLDPCPATWGWWGWPFLALAYFLLAVASSPCKRQRKKCNSKATFRCFRLLFF